MPVCFLRNKNGIKKRRRGIEQWSAKAVLSRDRSDLHVSVSGWDPPDLNPFQSAFLYHRDADIFVAVGTVTLGLRRAIWTAGATGVEPPRHQRNL